MSAGPSLKPMPTYRPGDTYSQENERRSRAGFSRELEQKHDKRSDLRVGQGMSLILTSPGFVDFAIGFDDNGLLTVTNYDTGVAGTFVIDWQDVQGLEAELLALESAYEAADVVLQAGITSNAGLITTNTNSIASINTELIAARDGEVDLAAKISSVETTATSADSAAAAAQSEITAARDGESSLLAQVNSIQQSVVDETTARGTAVDEVTARIGVRESGKGLLQNARFQEEFSGTDVPPEWVAYQGGEGYQISSSSEVPGKVFSMAGDAGATRGIYQICTVRAGRKYKIAAEIRRMAGTLVAAGIFVRWRDSGSGLSSSSIKFETDATTGNEVSASHNGWVRYEKVVEAPANADEAVFYCMTHFSTFGSIASANAIRWREANLEQVTEADATASILKDAFIDSDGNATATVRLVAAASGGTPAIIELLSSDGVSAVRLGGNTEIDGNLHVTGSITTDALASNAVTNTEVDQTSGAITPSNNTWTDVASFSFTSVGIGVQLRGSCEVDVFSDGTGPTAQVRLLRGATVLKTSKVFTSVDAGSGFVKVEQSVALDYNDLPSSGTYTYKLQALLNEGTGAVVVSTFDVTNRFLSATELKR